VFFIAALVLGIEAVLLVVALVKALEPEKRGRPAAMATIVTGVLLAMGVGLGWTLGPPLGLAEKYPRLISLSADGTLTVTLDGLEGFTAVADPPPAQCLSAPNEERVHSVGTYLVGHVDTNEVAASTVDLATEEPWLWVYLYDGVRSEAVIWTARLDVTELPADRRSSEVAFSATLDPEKAGAPITGPWPKTLLGTMRWSCEDWVRI
jgi:hypothetical protein